MILTSAITKDSLWEKFTLYRYITDFMKKIVVFFALFIIASCTNKKFVRKKVENGDIVVLWYYESYITSKRDFVEVQRGRQMERVMDFNGGNAHLDISIANDTITIREYEPKNMIVYSKKDKVFNYVIRYDTTATDNE